MSTLRERTQEMTAEYWEARNELTERVAVAQLILAFARCEVALKAATNDGEDSTPDGERGN